MKNNKNNPDVAGYLICVPHPEKKGHGILVDAETRLVISQGPMPPPASLLFTAAFILNHGGFEKAALEEGAEFWHGELPKNPQHDPRCGCFDLEWNSKDGPSITPVRPEENN